MPELRLPASRPAFIISATTTLAVLFIAVFRVAAQNSAVQERLAEIKAASAQNKQRLATYTWQEQETVSIRGEVRKQQTFQVRMGADGKPMKTPLNGGAQPQPAEGVGRRGGRLKERIVENKKEEYREYAQQIAALARSYVPPDPARLQQAFQQGNAKLQPGAAANQTQLLITSYLKPGDSMTLSIDRSAKAIQSVQIGSYLDSPGDAVKIAVQFAQLPDGTNHVATMVVEGVSKQLKVDVANSRYTKL